MNQFKEVDFKIDENTDGLLIEKYQEIPREYVDSLKSYKQDTKHTVAGEYHRAASIPQVIVEKWMQEGYNIFEEPVSKSLARLRAEGLDYFITTEKTL